TDAAPRPATRRRASPDQRQAVAAPGLPRAPDPGGGDVVRMVLWLAPPLILALCFLSGAAWPGRPEEPPAVVRGQAAHSGAVLRPGEGAVAAVAFLKTLRSDPPPPPPPPPP